LPYFKKKEYQQQGTSKNTISLATMSKYHQALEQKMQIISVNVGLPRQVIWKGKPVSTGIFKEPINERVMVRSLNLDVMDRQISPFMVD
jgi:hypothetical protein